MTGYFRVRSGTGTALTDLTFSDWTDGVSGTTAPPPAGRRVRRSGRIHHRKRDQRLDHHPVPGDEVDDADSYEAEQRLAGAGGKLGWTPIAAVTAPTWWTERAASQADWTRGTGYEFPRAGAARLGRHRERCRRVGPRPTASTTGRQQTTASGGMGDLDVHLEERRGQHHVSVGRRWRASVYEWEVLETFSGRRESLRDK